MIPSMSTRQPLAILFADVSGSTRLFEQRGDAEARRIIAAVLDALSAVCTSHGGRVIKTIGDEVMCTFPSALQGLIAACDMQRRVARDAAFARDAVGIRVGVHFGEALVEADDVFGDAVNVAARMAALAKREQIVTTAASLEGLTHVGGLRSRSLGRARVSGKLLPIEIVDLIWQDDTSDLTTVQRAVRMDEPDAGGARLVLRHRGRVIELTEQSEPFTLGRDAGSSLVVEAEWVSRHHATIEFKKGHFVVADRSTNATYVQLGDDAELRLHRDELHLRRSGTISLGQSATLNQQDLLHFHTGEA